MNIERRIKDWNEKGIILEVHNDKVKCSAPPGCINPTIMADIRSRKIEILNYLARNTKNTQNLFYVSDIKPAPEKESYRLSPSHRRYIADFTWDASTNWNTIILHFPFPLSADKDILEEALDTLCDKHECLKTCYPIIMNERRQVISDKSVISIEEIECPSEDEEVLLNCLAEIKQDAARLKWDCAEGRLGKVYFLKSKQVKYNTLVFAFHRLIMDGASARIFLTELLHITFSLSTGQSVKTDRSNLKYRDFSEWLNDLEDRDSFSSSRNYWKREFSLPIPDTFGFNSLAKGRDISKSSKQIIEVIPINIINKVKSRAKHEGILYSMLLFSIFFVSLSKTSRQKEVLVDASLSGRHRAELKNIVGFFSNAVGIRLNFDKITSFEELVSTVTHKYALAEEHQYYQYNRVVHLLRIPRSDIEFPLSGVLFSSLDIAVPVSAVLGRTSGLSDGLTDIRYGLMFYVMNYSDAVSLDIKFRPELLDFDTVGQLQSTFTQILYDFANGVDFQKLFLNLRVYK